MVNNQLIIYEHIMVVSCGYKPIVILCPTCSILDDNVVT